MPEYGEEMSAGRVLIVCTLPSGEVGKARLPPNGDRAEAQLRAFRAAERKRIEAGRI